MIRNRKGKDPIERVKQLDAFQKIPEEYQKSSAVGGSVSIISRLLIVYLIYLETIYYMNSKLIFKFTPDTDLHTKLRINIDVTVAMPCKSIGADILDSTNQNVFSFGVLEEEDTWWEMCPQQKQHFEYMQHLNRYLTEEYHSIAEVLYKSEQTTNYKMPERTRKLTKPYDACRVHGSLTLNKVAGNFHITAGKSIHFPQGHLHLNFMFDEVKQNFTHRITRLSFGDHASGIVQPLEFEEKVFGNDKTMMLYYIEVVPTDIETFLSHFKTYQYSVKENIRTIDHDKDSHGIPGLYFKYDVSALKVKVLLDREHMAQLTIRLCSVIAGVIVISGFINSILQFLFDKFLKIFAPQVYSIKYQNSINSFQPVVEKNNHFQTPQVKPNTNLLTNNLILSTNLESTNVPISLAISQ